MRNRERTASSTAQIRLQAGSIIKTAYDRHLIRVALAFPPSKPTSYLSALDLAQIQSFIVTQVISCYAH